MAAHPIDRQTVIAILRDHESELKAAGITRLSLFGSVARGEHGNDIDLAAELDASRQFSLLDMVRLENHLTDILGAPVDLAPARSLKQGILERVRREAVLAF